MFTLCVIVAFFWSQIHLFEWYSIIINIFIFFLNMKKSVKGKEGIYRKKSLLDSGFSPIFAFNKKSKMLLQNVIKCYAMFFPHSFRCATMILRSSVNFSVTPIFSLSLENIFRHSFFIIHSLESHVCFDLFQLNSPSIY